MNDSSAPTRPLCILHSDDAELRHRLSAILHERSYVCHAPDPMRLEELLGGNEPLLIFIDLRIGGGLELLPRLARLHPQAVAVALGHTDSVPFQAGAEAGVYRVESLDADRRTLRDLAERVLERVGWMQENHMLRDELARLRTMQQHAVATGRGGGSGSGRNPLGFRHLVKATQHLDRLEELFDKIVDGVASATMVTRVGLFYRHENDPFTACARAAAAWRTPRRWNSATAIPSCAGCNAIRA